MAQNPTPKPPPRVPSRAGETFGKVMIGVAFFSIGYFIGNWNGGRKARKNGGD